MKKIISLVLVAVLLVGVMFAFASCSGKVDDLKKIEKAEKLVVGVTVYPPMDYIDDETGEWVGFDAELAQMYAESLGVNCQIVIIKWDNKVAELDSNQIDLIWNGMTASDELGEKIDFSVSYAKNAQVAVVKAGSSIASKDAIKAASVAVERGSAGATVAEDEQMANVSKLDAQIDALNEVKAGTSQVAIVDITMAQSMVGKGEYADLKIVDGVSYGDELFAVGLRKGSNLKESLDQFLKDKYEDGTMAALVAKYGGAVGLNTEALSAK